MGQVSKGILIVYFHAGAQPWGVYRVILGNWPEPAKQPFGFARPHINTAMTHGGSEIFVPLGAVESLTIAGKEGCPGDAGQLVTVNTCEQIAIPHMFGRCLWIDIELAGRCGS